MRMNFVVVAVCLAGLSPALAQDAPPAGTHRHHHKAKIAHERVASPAPTPSPVEIDRSALTAPQTPNSAFDCPSGDCQGVNGTGFIGGGKPF